jgi:predicted transcriptional regulator
MPETIQTVQPNDREQEVLAVLAVRAANPYHIREETGLDKGAVNTALNKLARYGYVQQVTRGLYEITDEGREVVSGDE